MNVDQKVVVLVPVPSSNDLNTMLWSGRTLLNNVRVTMTVMRTGNINWTNTDSGEGQSRHVSLTMRC